jgi:hypothetical protein
LEKLRTDAAECALIRDLATDPKKRAVHHDLAPKFYPVLSSPRLLDLPGWAVGATGAGAEPSA